MEIVIILYRLGNNDKKKSLCMFSTDAAIVGLMTEYTSATTSRFFPNIFYLRLVESTDMESVDAEGQLYAFTLHSFDFTNIRY